MPWSTAPTFVAGSVVTTAQLNTLSGDLNTLGSAWTAYAPIATNWAVGNGTLLGRAITLGKTVFWRVSFTAGSTSTYTATQMAVSLPTAAAASTGEQIVSLKVYSGSANYVGYALIGAGATTAALAVTNGASNVVAMASGTITTGTTGNFSAVGFYEAA